MSAESDLTSRWCPTHRRYETNPPGRLRCSAAWRELYALEDEVKAQGVGTANALLQINAQLHNLTEAILDAIAPATVLAPPRPQPPRPAATPPKPAAGTIDL